MGFLTRLARWFRGAGAQSGQTALLGVFAILVLGTSLAGELRISGPKQTLGFTGQVQGNQQRIAAALQVYYNKSGAYPNPDLSGNGLAAAVGATPSCSQYPCWGLVPYQTIGMSKQDVLDQWGNRLTYAVAGNNSTSGSLYNSTAFCSSLSGTLLTSPPAAFSTLMTGPSASYLLISHGVNGRGAFNANMTQIPVPAGSAESYNCPRDVTGAACGAGANGDHAHYLAGPTEPVRTSSSGVDTWFDDQVAVAATSAGGSLGQPAVCSCLTRTITPTTGSTISYSGNTTLTIQITPVTGMSLASCPQQIAFSGTAVVGTSYTIAANPSVAVNSGSAPTISPVTANGTAYALTWPSGGSTASSLTITFTLTANATGSGKTITVASSSPGIAGNATTATYTIASNNSNSINNPGTIVSPTGAGNVQVSYAYSNQGNSGSSIIGGTAGREQVTLGNIDGSGTSGALNEVNGAGDASCAFLTTPLNWTTQTLRAYFELSFPYGPLEGDGSTLMILPGDTNLATQVCGATGSDLGWVGYSAVPTTATGAATITSGAITAIGVGTAGSGYSSAPTVTISGGGGSGATATATLYSGTVASIAVTAGGSGYTSAPTVSLSGGSGSGATAVASVSAGVVTAVRLTANGTGYTTVPTVSFSGGGGSGAAATAALGNSGGGAVTAFAVTATGSGYAAPSATISGGGGSGATASVTTSGGAVTAVTVANGGSGYTSAPTVTFAGGTGATATATVSGGKVTAITVTNGGSNFLNIAVASPAGTGAVAVANLVGTSVQTVQVTSGGSGYTSAPTVTISGNNCTGVTATATIGSGSVSAVNVNSGGSNCTRSPTVAFSGGGGSGAAATAYLTPASINTVTVSSGGTGYTSTPSVSISDQGSGGLAIANVATTGTVSGLTLTANGSGYTSNPTVSFSGGGGTGATATASASGTVTAVNLGTHGSGYTSTPTVTISGGGGSGATATATRSGNQVSAVTLTAGGSGYTSTPTVTISGGGGTGATATATVTNEVLSVTLTSGGSGYTSTPTVAFSGGGGTGAAATATTTINTGVSAVNIVYGGSGYPPNVSVNIVSSDCNANGSGATATATVANGVVAWVGVTASGTGYTSAPTVTVTDTGGTGSGATATAAISDIVGSVTVGTGGSGYTSAPVVTISGGGGSGATATATVNGGVVSAVTVTTAGSGYTSAPTVSFTGGGGSGATATATVTNGVVAVQVTAGGSSYTSPAISFSGGGGSGATATAQVANGVITGVTMTAAGSNYITSSPPAVIFGGYYANGTAATNANAVSSVTFANNSNANNLCNGKGGYAYINPTISFGTTVVPKMGMEYRTYFYNQSDLNGNDTRHDADTSSTTTSTLSSSVSHWGIDNNYTDAVWGYEHIAALMVDTANHDNNYHSSSLTSFTGGGAIGGPMTASAGTQGNSTETDKTINPSCDTSDNGGNNTHGGGCSWQVPTAASLPGPSFTCFAAATYSTWPYDECDTAHNQTGTQQDLANGWVPNFCQIAGNSNTVAYSCPAGTPYLGLMPQILTDTSPDVPSTVTRPSTLLSYTQNSSTVYFHPVRIEMQHYCNSNCSSCGNVGVAADNYVLMRAYLDCQSAALGGNSCSDMTQNLLMGSSFPLGSGYSTANTINYCALEPGGAKGAFDTILLGFSTATGGATSNDNSTATGGGGLIIQNAQFGTY